MLGDRGSWLVDPIGQLVDRQLLVDQRPEKTHAGGVGQHPEDLDSELGLLDRQLSATTNSTICVHAQIVSGTVRSSHRVDVASRTVEGLQRSAT